MLDVQEVLMQLVVLDGFFQVSSLCQVSRVESVLHHSVQVLLAVAGQSFALVCVQQGTVLALEVFAVSLPSGLCHFKSQLRLCLQ